MVDIFRDAALDDDSRRRRLYAGDLFLYSPHVASRACVLFGIRANKTQAVRKAQLLNGEARRREKCWRRHDARRPRSIDYRATALEACTANQVVHCTTPR